MRNNFNDKKLKPEISCIFVVLYKIDITGEGKHLRPQTFAKTRATCWPPPTSSPSSHSNRSRSAIKNVPQYACLCH